jgi:hypothetical protein
MEFKRKRILSYDLKRPNHEYNLLSDQDESRVKLPNVVS